MLGLPLLGILGLCMLVLLGCGTAASIADRAATDGWFTAASPVASIGFQHRSGPPGRYFYPRTIGSGAALLDCNNDGRLDNEGRLDLFLTTNAGPDADSYNGLYEQQSDGTFVDVAQQAGRRLAGYFQAIGAADVNHDGWIDLCLAGLNETSVYINREGRFERLPDDHGVINPNWGTGVAFAEPNRDGLLDLVVANYVEYATDGECASLAGGKEFCGPHHFPATTGCVSDCGTRSGIATISTARPARYGGESLPGVLPSGVLRLDRGHGQPLRCPPGGTPADAGGLAALRPPRADHPLRRPRIEPRRRRARMPRAAGLADGPAGTFTRSQPACDQDAEPCPGSRPAPRPFDRPLAARRVAVRRALAGP